MKMGRRVGNRFIMTHPVFAKPLDHPLSTFGA
jgi:hypothetical protein